MDQNQTADANLQNQTSVDNDLQKAIDNITNNTNVDPVFSDPVAAPSSVPEGDTGELSEPVGPFPEPKVEMVSQETEAIAPLEAAANIPELNPTPEPEPTPVPTPESTPEPTAEIKPETTTQSTENLSTHQIKEAALRDLLPLLDHLDITPSQKFKIYRSIFEDLKDYTVLEPAYKVAKEVPDETERAKDLLYIIESIDKM